MRRRERRSPERTRSDFSADLFGSGCETLEQLWIKPQPYILSMFGPLQSKLWKSIQIKYVPAVRPCIGHSQWVESAIIVGPCRR